MTVCIGAIADYGGGEWCIVTASDRMIGSESGSSEGFIKIERLSKNWFVMFAGSDVSQVSTVLGTAREALGTDAQMENGFPVIRSIFKGACRKRLSELAGDRFLSPFGLEMADFIERGRDVFPEQVYYDLSNEIRRVTLGCEFIVYGFDPDKNPHIFKVVQEYAGTGPEDINCRVPGFAVIGIGRTTSEVILYALDQNIHVPWTETIYNLCAAKFMAERVAGVGKDTFLHVRKAGSSSFSQSARLIPEIRAAWEKQGAPRLPAGVVEWIKNSGGLEVT